MLTKEELSAAHLALSIYSNDVEFTRNCKMTDEWILYLDRVNSARDKIGEMLQAVTEDR